MIRAYWLRVVLFALVFAAGGYITSKRSAPRFEATAQILIDQQQLSSSMAMSQSEKSTQDLLSFARPRSIETQVEQLTSFGILERAGSLAAADLQKPPPLTPESEFFATNLFSKIFVDAQPNSDIITLKVYMDTPEAARIVAQQIYNAFDAQNKENAKLLGIAAQNMLEGQMAPIKQGLKEVSDELEKLRSRTKTSDLVTKINVDANARSGIEIERDRAELDYAFQSSRLTTLRGMKAKVPPMIDSVDVSTPNPLLQQAQGRLQDARAERSQLLTQYDENAIPLQEADRKIKYLEGIVGTLAKQVVASRTRQPNPIYQSLVQQISEAESLATAAKARAAKAQEVVDARIAEGIDIPRQLTEYDELIRRKENLTRQYQNLSDQLDTLTTSKVGRSAVSQLVTAPFAKPEAISPRPTGNALTAGMAGLVLALISVFLAESKRQPIRTIAQMNSLAFDPVFRVIPELDAVRRGFTPRIHESFETLLLNFLHSPNRPYTIGVVGITPGAGATHTAASLATAAIRHGFRVNVVDHDPKQAMKRVADRGQRVIKQAGDRLNIQYFAGDPAIDSPAELAIAPELVIHDFTPATHSADYALESARLDEMVVLVRAGNTRSVDFMQVQQALKDAGCRQITLVFTRSRDFTVVADTMERQVVQADFA